MTGLAGDQQQPLEQRQGSAALDELATPGAGPSSAAASNNTGMGKRAKTGCITCRVRKKRCDERKPECASCERLGIQCMGYGAKRPGWLRGDDNRKKVRADLKKQIMTQRNGRSRDDSTDQDQDLDQDQDQDSEPLYSAGGTGRGGGYGFGGRDDAMPVPVTATTISSGYSTNMDQHHPHQAGPTLPAWQSQSFETANPNHQNTVGVGTLPPVDTQAQALWNLADASTWAMQPAPPPPDPAQSQALTLANANGGETTDADATFEDLWKTLFGDLSGFSPTPATPPPQIHLQQPDPTADLTLLSVFSPSQIGAADNRHVGYLHHYLNVVLPLQYRLGSRQLTDLIGPLAMTRNEVLKSAASLAALHLVAQRTKKPLSLPSSWNDGPDSDPTLETVEDADDDTMIARSAHRQSIERLRFLTSDDLTSEDVIVSALFAISFHLFSGGTSREWKEVMATSQRCLSAALNGSPEITGAPQLYNFDTPWQRYKPLIAVMIWMDILGSVSQNKASRLLPTYRQLLDQCPIMSTKPQLMMANVMGCDNTTMLALAETVNLSEWKEMAEQTGCLSIKELMHRAAAIEKLLAERSWREGLLEGQRPHPDPSGVEEPAENQSMIQVMREVFFNAAKVFLATVVHGPFPRVPEVAAAVQDVTESLHRLDITQPDDLEINRALVLPITLAGCHCQTSSQQAFFRGRFQRLGNDAAAFGNSRQALLLMEEVWRQRALAEPGQKVCWRRAMRDLGWDVGILLI